MKSKTKISVRIHANYNKMFALYFVFSSWTKDALDHRCIDSLLCSCCSLVNQLINAYLIMGHNNSFSATIQCAQDVCKFSLVWTVER